MKTNTTIASRIRAAVAAVVLSGKSTLPYSIYLPDYGMIGEYQTPSDAFSAIAFLPAHLRASAAIADADGNLMSYC